MGSGGKTTDGVLKGHVTKHSPETMALRPGIGTQLHTHYLPT